MNAPLPDWLHALLAERYPHPPAAIQLLTLALRPAATAHLMVQPCTDEELLTGQLVRVRLTQDTTLPEPLFT